MKQLTSLSEHDLLRDPCVVFHGKWPKIMFTVAILAQGTLLRHGKLAGLFAFLRAILFHTYQSTHSPQLWHCQHPTTDIRQLYFGVLRFLHQKIRNAKSCQTFDFVFLQIWIATQIMITRVAFWQKTTSFSKWKTVLRSNSALSKSFYDDKFSSIYRT